MTILHHLQQGSLASIHTSLVHETFYYYMHKGSNVYGLILDASKAFNHVNYGKPFRTIVDKNVGPLYYRLLLNMCLKEKRLIRC